MEFGVPDGVTFEASEMRAFSGAGVTTVLVGSPCVISCIGLVTDVSVFATTIGVFMSAVEIDG